MVGYEQSSQEAVDILEMAGGSVIMHGDDNKCLELGHLVKHFSKAKGFFLIIILQYFLFGTLFLRFTASCC